MKGQRSGKGEKRVHPTFLPSRSYMYMKSCMKTVVLLCLRMFQTSRAGVQLRKNDFSQFTLLLFVKTLDLPHTLSQFLVFFAEKKTRHFFIFTITLANVDRFLRSASSVMYCYRKSSVRPSVCPSVTLMYAGHIGWTSSKVIARIISLGSSLLGNLV